MAQFPFLGKGVLLGAIEEQHTGYVQAAIDDWGLGLCRIALAYTAPIANRRPNSVDIHTVTKRLHPLRRKAMAHQFTCDACGFQIRSEDDNELIGIVQTHADEKHDMSVSDADVRDGWEEARLEADD